MPPKFSQSLPGPNDPVTTPLTRTQTPAQPAQTNTSDAPVQSTASDTSSQETPAGVVNTSSDTNAYLKANRIVQALGSGQLRLISIADDKNDKGTPSGQLAVVVANPSGELGTMLLGPEGNVTQPPSKADGTPLNMPSPRSSTGTAPEQTNAAANAANAATNAQKADRVYTQGGVTYVTHPDGTTQAIGTAQPTNPQETLPKDVGGRHYVYKPGEKDADGNPQPGQWVDSGVATPTVGEQNQATQQGKQDQLTANRDAANREAQQATADAARTRNDIDRQVADWTRQYQAGELAEQQYRDKLQAAMQQSQQAIDRANLALKAQEIAQTAWYQQQQVSSQQQQNTNSANLTSLQAARDAETNRANLTTEATQKGQLGANALNDRATHATSLLNSWVNNAAGNKNFGLGGANLQGMASGLMSDAGNFATEQMGGQSTMDAAAQMVHAANPEASGTPQGSAWTGIVSQMLDRLKASQTNQQQTGQQEQKQPDGNQTQSNQTIDGSKPNGSNPLIDPSDHDFLKNALVSAIQQIGTYQAPTQAPVPQPTPVQVTPPKQNVTLSGNVDINKPITPAPVLSTQYGVNPSQR